MNEVSTVRGVTAVEGYIVEDIKRHRAQAKTSDYVLRSEKAIEWAETIEAAMSGPVVSLVELLVTRGLGTQSQELDTLIDKESEKVGKVLSDSITNLVAAMIERDEKANAAEERAVPTERMGPGGPLPPMHYLGVWKDAGAYVPGDVTTYRGTSWHCGLPTTSRPGTNHDWQMMGKSDRERATA